MVKKIAGGSLISVVIPSYNQAETIRACLNSVLNQNTNRKYEVIVVDSGNDNTSQIIRADFPGVKLVSLRKRAYPGKARNTGVKKAKGGIIAFTDADCVVARNWISALVSAHKKHDVVCGKIMNGNPDNYTGWGLFLAEFGQLMQDKDKFVSNTTTCNVSYKREIFGKYGFLDNHGYSSDWKFHARLKEPIFFSRNMSVRHINRTGFSALKHAFHIGYHDAFAKKELRTDYFLLKYPFLILLFIMYRFLETGFQALHANALTRFFVTSPAVFAALTAWYAGFFKGALNITRGKKPAK